MTKATALWCTATAALGWGCGAGNRGLTAAEARAEGETPSVEVALDRLEDLRTLDRQLDDLTMRTPIGAGAPWAEHLASIPADRAAALGEAARNRPPYDLAGSRVAVSRIYALHNEEALARAAGYSGWHASFMDALGALGAPEGSRIRSRYEGVKASRSEMAEAEGTIAGLRSEADHEATQPRRRAIIEEQIAAAEGRLEALALKSSGAEAELYDGIAALREIAAPSGEARALASTLFAVAQHVVRMEDEALITSRLALLQLERAQPAMAAELQSMGERLLCAAAREAGVADAAAVSARVTVFMEGGAFSAIGVSGLAPTEIGPVQQSLARRFDVIRDRIAAAASTAATADAMARFERDLFLALCDALGALSGDAFAEAPELPLSEPRRFAGGSGTCGAGLWDAPARPEAPPPAPETPPAPLPAPRTEPEGEQSADPSALECPPALCGGAITVSSVGGLSLGMTGRDVAAILGRPFAAKKDAFHAEPVQNVGGVVFSFCGELVCRLEVTVTPPATREGFGVDSKLAELAKTYGQSKCRPVDASRFGVEFEGMEGVLWISDRLRCDGIEDTEYWDRPLVGNVTSVVVGSPRH